MWVDASFVEDPMSSLNARVSCSRAFMGEGEDEMIRTCNSNMSLNSPHVRSRKTRKQHPGAGLPLHHPLFLRVLAMQFDALAPLDEHLVLDGSAWLRACRARACFHIAHVPKSSLLALPALATWFKQCHERGGSRCGGSRHVLQELG